MRRSGKLTLYLLAVYVPGLPVPRYVEVLSSSMYSIRNCQYWRPGQLLL